MAAMTLILFVSGFVLLIVGGELLVRGASKLAEALGIPPVIIGYSTLRVNKRQTAVTES